MEVAVSWWYYGRWVLLALAIAALVFWFYRIVKKRRAEPKEKRQKPKLPPYELAMQQLNELESEKLWQEGQIKLYYSRLVDVLRIYLEREFAIKAMESTAAELSQKIRRFDFDKMQNLQAMLTTSAMVKYAREKPLPEENERALELVRQFVEKTHKPQNEPNAEVPVRKS